MQKQLNIDSLSKIIKRNQIDLQSRGVKTLAVFGSFARGENSPSSDIDILVEFNRPVGLFEFIRLKMKLEELTGTQVDLVTSEALRPEMRENILREAINVS